MKITEDVNWYIVNYSGAHDDFDPEKDIDSFNLFKKTKLECFSPAVVIDKDSSEKPNLHYIFVKGSFSDVEELCAGQYGFVFTDNGSSHREDVVDEEKIIQLKDLVDRKKKLSFVTKTDVDLGRSDEVEVVRGVYAGLKGYYLPNPRSKSGDLVIDIIDDVGIIVYDVRTPDLRVLKFSDNSTRINDNIKRFMSRLMLALRYYHSDGIIPESLADKLVSFCRRMEMIKINKSIANARLHILLYAANYIIGNTEEAEDNLELFYSAEASATNEWTKASFTLILSVLNEDMNALASAYEIIKDKETKSEVKKALKKEYQYYLDKWRAER